MDRIGCPEVCSLSDGKRRPRAGRNARCWSARGQRENHVPLGTTASTGQALLSNLNKFSVTIPARSNFVVDSKEEHPFPTKLCFIAATISYTVSEMRNRWKTNIILECVLFLNFGSVCAAQVGRGTSNTKDSADPSEGAL